jgi:hypothetical protein
MTEQTTPTTETLLPITSIQLSQVSGGSIYVDGIYQGEGNLDLRPWPGGFPVVERPNMRFI